MSSRVLGGWQGAARVKIQGGRELEARRRRQLCPAQEPKPPGGGCAGRCFLLTRQDNGPWLSSRASEPAGSAELLLMTLSHSKQLQEGCQAGPGGHKRGVH